MNNLLKSMKFLLLILSVIFFVGCNGLDDEELKKARVALENGAILVDVRTDKEFRQGHAKGAVNIPIDSIMKGDFKLSKAKELIVYCRTGSRSKAVARVLRYNGWVVYDVINQREWERKITPK